ncbi:GNAT family N-acetyltransferase, partial [Candidatus Bathyarchaeota archaeon]|nr:GNAT family N-acetyltransferase [Candidatus Bathyarchaeota archaeon]
MSENYIFRSYKPGDEKKISELLSNVFNGWPHIDTDLSSEEYWSWKYLHNPVHKSQLSFGFDGKKAISCHHNMVVELKIMNQTILGCAAQDFAVHPNYRGKGLSSKTSTPNEVRRKKEAVIFSYFITRNPKLIQMYSNSKNPENRRPRFPQDIINLTRIRDVDLHFKNIPVKNQTLIKTGVKALKAWNKTTNQPEPENTLRVTEVQHFEDDIDIFIETILQEHNFMIIRSAKYLNWKYAYPKLGDY